MIRQSAFFKLAAIIPETEAVEYLKDSIKKAYGKKGEKVVNMNHAAIDKGIDAIVEITVPAEWANAKDEVVEAKGKLKQLAPEIELSKNKVLKKAKKKRAAKVGDNIIVSSYGQRGTLTKRFKDGRWEAQVGLIKMTLQESEFDLVKSDKAQASQKRQAHLVKRTSQKAPSARLDLRGKRYEEAMQELDEFIDQALLNNMAQVDIIHGIGTGVIRDGVTKYLRRNKQVKEFGYAPQNAGGSGATIVTFK